MVQESGKMVHKRRIRLHNLTCPYCGCELSDSNSSKEHVVGRRFVPKGSLDNQANIILNACQNCNSQKSKMEGVISAITMQPTVSGEYACNDDIYRQESKRKGRTRLEQDSKLVENCFEQHHARFNFFGNSTLTISYLTPPQINFDTAYALARLHCAAIFYTTTYNASLKRGYYWVGSFYPLCLSLKQDFGNDIMLYFMDRTQNWLNRAIFITANGNFKSIIRKEPFCSMWSFAFEWNHNCRVIGIFGDKSCAEKFSSELPVLGMKDAGQSIDGYKWRVRLETPLPQDKDIMFDSH